MGMHADLLEACTRLADALQGWYGLVAGGCALVGFGMAGCSLLALRRHAEERRPLGGPLAGIVLGSLLMSFKAFLDAVSLTLFQASAPSALAAGHAGGGALEPLVRLAVTLVMLVGLYQCAKGRVLLKRAAFGGSSFWQGTTHILGGVLCINIETFMRALGGTLGGPMAGLVETLLGKG